MKRKCELCHKDERMERHKLCATCGEMILRLFFAIDNKMEELTLQLGLEKRSYYTVRRP